MTKLYMFCKCGRWMVPNRDGYPYCPKCHMIYEPPVGMRPKGVWTKL